MSDVLAKCDVSARIGAILAKYASYPNARIDDLTTLLDLGVDCLDQPMIALDIEDALDVNLSACRPMADTTTLRDLVEGAIAAKAAQLETRRIRASTPRAKRSWLSTEAEHRY